MVDIVESLYNYRNIKIQIKILKSELEILENDYRGVGIDFDSIEIVKRKIDSLNREVNLVDCILKQLTNAEVEFVKGVFFEKKRYKEFLSEIFYINGLSDGNISSLGYSYKLSIINKIKMLNNSNLNDD